MRQKEKYISKLLIKYINRTCSVREIRKLNNWINEEKENKEFIQEILNPYNLQQDLNLLNSFDGKKAWQKNWSNKSSINWGLTLKWIIAASIFIVSVSFLFYSEFSSDHSPSLEISKYNINPKFEDKQPAQLGAQLTFSNGKKIILNKPLELKSSGDIIYSDNHIIGKLDSNGSKDNVEWLEIQVPSAQYYSLKLPDSTLVLLNSNSTIKFPSKFEQKARILTIQGEAYFNVKNNHDQLFIVRTEQADIRVIGTSFNVNNYNQTLIATLAEGKINIESKLGNKSLIPSQKVIVTDKTIQLAEANLQKELAWKNKKFHFQNDKLEDILFQIENWYGIKTNYQNFKNHKETFSGTIDRNVSLSQFLDMLSKTSNYQFQIINNNLIITLNKKTR